MAAIFGLKTRRLPRNAQFFPEYCLATTSKSRKSNLVQPLSVLKWLLFGSRFLVLCPVLLNAMLKLSEVRISEIYFGICSRISPLPRIQALPDFQASVCYGRLISVWQCSPPSKHGVHSIWAGCRSGPGGQTRETVSSDLLLSVEGLFEVSWSLRFRSPGSKLGARGGELHLGGGIILPLALQHLSPVRT